jgi:hypothetical protein
LDFEIGEKDQKMMAFGLLVAKTQDRLARHMNLSSKESIKVAIAKLCSASYVLIVSTYRRIPGSVPLGVVRGVVDDETTRAKKQNFR